jgi:hypothetical protein
LVDVLQAMGWTVFWDRMVPTRSTFDQAIESALDAAKCVIVLWSQSSVGSAFVRGEAHRGVAGGTLLPVLIDEVEPPMGFGQLNMVNLVGWTGQPEQRVEELVRSVATIIDRPKSIAAFLTPVDLHLVTGAIDRYPDLGATVNTRCRLTNSETFGLELKALELKATRDGHSLLDLVPRLFYAARGGEHTQVTGSLPVAIGPASSWESGVQFRDERTDIPNVWPAGQYEFDLTGLVTPLSTAASSLGATTLRTTFRAIVTQSVESQLARWRNASKTEWDQSYASDRARGFTLNLTDINVVTGRSSPA